MYLDTVSPLHLDRDERYIKVVLYSVANILDCLSLSEALQAEDLVERTAIYLSPNLVVAPSIYISLENHYLKVFLKKGVSQEAGLKLSQTLKSNALVKQAHFFPDKFFTQIKVLCKAKLLRAYLRIQKCIEETDELLALLERRRNQ